MKQLYLLAFLLLGIILVCLGQPSKTAENNQKINQYIRTGDAASLSQYMQDMVELVMNHTAETYSKNQVTSILKEFFRENPPQNFEVLQSWKEDEATYTLGTYTSTNEMQYRFYYVVKKSGQNKNAKVSVYHINIEQTKKCKNKCTQNQNVSK